MCDPRHKGWRECIGYNLSCRSLSAKEPPNIGLFCRKSIVKIRHPMRLRHLIWVMTHLHVKRDPYVPKGDPGKRPRLGL